MRMTDAELKKFLKQTNGRCGICWGDLELEDFRSYSPTARYLGKWEGTKDHIVPQAHGGGHERSNLQPTHRGCNSRKGTKHVVRARLKHGAPPWGPQSPGTRAVLAGSSAALGGGLCAYAFGETRADGTRELNAGAGVVGGILTGLLALGLT